MDWTGPRQSGNGDRRTGLIWLFRNATHTHTHERNDLRNTKHQIAEKKKRDQQRERAKLKKEIVCNCETSLLFWHPFRRGHAASTAPKVWTTSQRNREFYIWLFGQEDRLSERNWKLPVVMGPQPFLIKMLTGTWKNASSCGWLRRKGIQKFWSERTRKSGGKWAQQPRISMGLQKPQPEEFFCPIGLPMGMKVPGNIHIYTCMYVYTCIYVHICKSIYTSILNCTNSQIDPKLYLQM